MAENPGPQSLSDFTAGFFTQKILRPLAWLRGLPHHLRFCLLTEHLRVWYPATRPRTAVMKMTLRRRPSQNAPAKTTPYAAMWEEAFMGSTMMGNVESRAKAKAPPALKKPRWYSEGAGGSHPEQVESCPQRAGPPGREPQPDPPCRTAEQAGVAAFPNSPASGSLHLLCRAPFSQVHTSFRSTPSPSVGPSSTVPFKTFKMSPGW